MAVRQMLDAMGWARPRVFDLGADFPVDWRLLEAIAAPPCAARSDGRDDAGVFRADEGGIVTVREREAESVGQKVQLGTDRTRCGDVGCATTRRRSVFLHGFFRKATAMGPPIAHFFGQADASRPPAHDPHRCRSHRMSELHPRTRSTTFPPRARDSFSPCSPTRGVEFHLVTSRDPPPHRGGTHGDRLAAAWGGVGDGLSHDHPGSATYRAGSTIPKRRALAGASTGSAAALKAIKWPPS